MEWLGFSWWWVGRGWGGRPALLLGSHEQTKQGATHTNIRTHNAIPSTPCRDHYQDEEAKYAKVIKIGSKLYGVPAVEPGTFGTDIQQQTGRRWEELVYELNGEALFNREPVYALPDQGTKSNPVLVRVFVIGGVCVVGMEGVGGTHADTAFGRLVYIFRAQPAFCMIYIHPPKFFIQPATHPPT